MARREGNKLTDKGVKALKKPGHYGDGHGLWLQVSDAGTKSWAFRFMRQGRQREHGLGAIHTVSLGEAREAARTCRKLLREGIDPIEHARVRRLGAALSQAKVKTFAECAEEFVASREAEWKPGHASEWRSSFRIYCGAINDLPVAAVDTNAVQKVLSAVWNDSPWTGKKLRLRIERVLDAARVRQLRPDVPNPARWKGHLDTLFSSPAKVKPITHHEAVPLDRLPEIMAKLRQSQRRGAKALVLLVLTAVRAKQVQRMAWSEIDWQARVWISASENVKGVKGTTKPHRVPLADEALEVLHSLPREAELVFPRMSNNAMRKELRELDGEAVPHGFRSAFKDWSRKQGFPDELSELALSHSVGNQVRRSYARDDLVEERRPMMEAWARFCMGEKRDNVVALKGKRHG